MNTSGTQGTYRGLEDLDRLIEDDPPLSARLLRARDDFFRALAALESAGKHPIELLVEENGAGWIQHHRYPEGTAESWVSGQSWYYHSHRASTLSNQLGRSAEHGHFHTFVDSIKIDPDAVPIAAPKGRERARCVTHLVGLSIGMNGLPTELFALSRRTSDEMMFAGSTLMPHLRSFWKGLMLPHALTGNWLSALLRMFEPEVGHMLARRDQMQLRLNRHWLKARLELLQPEVIASQPVSLEERLEYLNRLKC